MYLHVWNETCAATAVLRGRWKGQSTVSVSKQNFNTETKPRRMSIEYSECTVFEGRLLVIK